MKTGKRIFLNVLFLFVPVISVFSQTELAFGNKKIRISGEEIMGYKINANSHVVKDYIKVNNGTLLYTSVEFEGNIPVRIELTECNITDLDKSSCAVAFSDQAALYYPGRFYILYLYTNKDAANIITTIYDDPSSMAIVHKSSVARLKFSDEKAARNFLEEYIQ